MKLSHILRDFGEISHENHISFSHSLTLCSGEKQNKMYYFCFNPEKNNNLKSCGNEKLFYCQKMTFVKLNTLGIGRIATFLQSLTHISHISQPKPAFYHD